MELLENTSLTSSPTSKSLESLFDFISIVPVVGNLFNLFYALPAECLVSIFNGDSTLLISIVPYLSFLCLEYSVALGASFDRTKGCIGSWTSNLSSAMASSFRILWVVFDSSSRINTVLAQPSTFLNVGLCF